MRPILLEEAPKVISAVRQAASTKRILTKLLTRMLLTDDAIVQSQLMRLRGFSLMAMILDEHKDEHIEVILPVFEVMTKWPLLSRNKLSNTTIEAMITNIIDTSPEEKVKEVGQQLITTWSALEVAYRIPRALKVCLRMV